MSEPNNAVLEHPLARLAVFTVLAAMLAGCSGRDADWIASSRRPRKKRRSRRTAARGQAVRGFYLYRPGPAFAVRARRFGLAERRLRPDSKRNREFLEQFSLDTLKMVGTLNLGANRYGLVATKDGACIALWSVNIWNQRRQDHDITRQRSLWLRSFRRLGGYIERPAAWAERMIGRRHIE